MNASLYSTVECEMWKKRIKVFDMLTKRSQSYSEPYKPISLSTMSERMERPITAVYNNIQTRENGSQTERRERPRRSENYPVNHRTDAPLQRPQSAPQQYSYQHEQALKRKQTNNGSKGQEKTAAARPPSSRSSSTPSPRVLLSRGHSSGSDAVKATNKRPSSVMSVRSTHSEQIPAPVSYNNYFDNSRGAHETKKQESRPKNTKRPQQQRREKKHRKRPTADRQFIVTNGYDSNVKDIKRHFFLRRDEYLQNRKLGFEHSLRLM